MAYSCSVFIFLLISVLCHASLPSSESVNVPVIIWGDRIKPMLKSNPLTLTTTPEFSEILSEELASDPFTVVFIEQTLSVEDLSHRNADGETSFPYLHKNLKSSAYLPSVSNPVSAFYLLQDPKKVDILELTDNGLSVDEADSGRFLFINLKDAVEGESRSELLRRHDDFMDEMVTSLKNEHDNVLAVYTARNPSWVSTHRVRRQAAAPDTDYKLDGLRLYAKNIRLVEGDSNTVLTALSSSTTDFNSTWMYTTLNFKESSIVLNFRSTGGYWFFDTVTLSATEELRPETEVYALINFSYRCGQNVTFSKGNSTRHVIFEDLKVQPVFHNTSAEEPVVFGDSFNCVGFFSAPIWSGLFVVFILLSITFYGIMMMMDIRTMDRFDDPKGKTITINAGE